jgi:hypothetical protein
MLKNKSKYVQARKGSEFEDRFEDVCKQQGFTRKLASDISEELKLIKSEIFDDFNESPIENRFNEHHNMVDFFVSQPFGSQNYPDFLLFTQKYIVPIEIKYSSDKSKKPMWNGNIPKANGIYIFGNNIFQDFTFFKGNYILPKAEKDKLFQFWDDTTALYEKHKKQSQELLEEDLLQIEYGFDVYPRKTFQQNKQINKSAILDFFDNEKREEIEKKTLQYLGSLDDE